MDPALCLALAEMDSAETRAAFADPAYGGARDLTARSWHQTLALYVTIGVGHILPGGTDHILFILALVVSTRRLKSLALQISAFTLAHTATLGLAATGVISPPASIVEPLIAATIAFVGFEAVWLRQPPPWRLAVVFAFGLVHGLGFAGFFGSLGLPEGQFLFGLIGFNIGVEIGQLGIALIGAAALWGLARAMGPQTELRGVRMGAGVLIGLVGAWWTLQRIAFGA